MNRPEPPASAAPVDVRVPALPESVSEGTVVAWRKAPGEAVRRDEPLVDIETDKVVLEVPAPADGVLAEVLKEPGASVRGEEVIARIAPGAAPAPSPEPAAEAPPAGSPAVEEGTPQTETEPKAARRRPPPGPAVRRLLAEHGLDPEAIPATGRGGRLTKADVLRYLKERHAAAEAAPSAAPERPAEPAPAAGPAPGGAPAAPPEPAAAPAPPAGGRRERREPMSRLRARIAERMLESQRTTATLTTFNEIDMQAVMALRRRHGEAFRERHGVKLGLMSFFVKACVAALRRHPVLNAFIDGSDIVYHDYYDIGIAVATPRGLVVPVLRDADRLGLADIERRIADFAERARAGTLTLEELTGGTFTITNGGVFGSLLSTPILNPPQSGILGMHRIQERPVVVEGEIVVRPMMYVALSYDHRLIDGADAVRFLVTVKELIEAPERLLLDI